MTISIIITFKFSIKKYLYKCIALRFDYYYAMLLFFGGWSIIREQKAKGNTIDIHSNIKIYYFTNFSCHR